MSLPLLVCLPVCAKDAHLFRPGMAWFKELDGRQNATAVISFDSLTPDRQGLRALALTAFERVVELLYLPPPPGYWPPSWAWQQTARFMARHGKPWYWHEADAWPLRPGWLRALAAGYAGCDRPCMGPKVPPPYRHVNGTCVYPAETPRMFPLAMNIWNGAWDMAMAPYMNRVADTRLIQHAWTTGPACFLPSGGGNPPTFPDASRLAWIWPEAVIFHRCKDASLINLLRAERISKLEPKADYQI